MEKTENELFGRKTFFIAPDTSLIPKTYLEEFMLQGFQAFIINDDYTCALQKKVRDISNLFPNSILYFNIDSSIEGVDWKSYIRDIQNNSKNDILIGVFYISRKDPKEEESIRNYYLNELKISAGCFALSAHDHNNFDSILNIMKKNDAKGRRSLVRAKCDSSSKVNFEYSGKEFFGPVLDVNLTHFRCDLKSATNDFKIFDKIRNVNLSINDFNFTSDAVLIMKREFGNEILCVFMFIKPDDSPDLEKGIEKNLNQKIYQIVLDENSEILNAAFTKSEN